MSRNLFRRVEVAFPIEDESQRKRIFEETLGIPLLDNTQAWELSADGSYQQAKPGRAKPRVSQNVLLEKLTDFGVP